MSRRKLAQISSQLGKLKLKKLPDPRKDFVGSGFCIYAGEKVDISHGATIECGVVHVPITHDELCFVNSKSGLSLLFNVFDQSNKDSGINSLSITNKSELPVLSNVANKLDLCITWKPSKFWVMF